MEKYPESPTVIPDKFTKPSSSYQIRTTLAILGIFLFFTLYFAMVTLLGFLVERAIFYEVYEYNRWSIILKIGAILGASMLFVFTLKFIFKIKSVSIKNRVELSKSEYPQVWDFVLKICKETGAPKPRKIYADPDVNAYVAFSRPWLSLFLPVPKDLTIGLGLVECLNLSEIKAVISHEFGHFAQRSMKVGSYIMTSNTIIHDMIYNRDKWDELLVQWRSVDIRLSAAAWAITPIIWLIRQILALFYQLLNIMYSSLSREMEFNADKYAVKTTGSDAICSSLWRLDHGTLNWNQTLELTYLASKKDLHSKNIYKVFKNVMDLERAEQTKKMNELEENELGGKQYFSTSELSKAGMYASHPPNESREKNAKSPYIPCEENQTSAWSIFEDPTVLQEKLTTVIFSQYLNKNPEKFCSTEEFMSFIELENSHKNLHKSLDNTFDNRFLEIPKNEDLTRTELLYPEAVKNIQTLKDSLKELTIPVKQLEERIETIHAIHQGTTKLKSIKIEQKEYKKKELSKAFEITVKELEELRNTSFSQWDRLFCESYYVISKRIGRDKELLALYQQHRNLVRFFRFLTTSYNNINQKLVSLQESEVSQSEVNTFGESVNVYLDKINERMIKLNTYGWIPLPNLGSSEEYLNFVNEGGEFTKGKGPMFENGEFGRIFQELQAAQNHCQRVDLLSIGAILSLHNEIESSTNKSGN